MFRRKISDMIIRHNGYWQKKFLILTFFVFFTLFFSFDVMAKSNDIYYIPVTRSCIQETADEFDIPEWLIFSILDLEGGSIGMKLRNTNNSYDIGPMQINTIWMPKLREMGITEHMLRFNGCLNVSVGVSILCNSLMQSNNFWEGVGGYHSKTPYLNKKYRYNVYKRAVKLKNVDKVIERANNVRRGLNYVR